MFEILGTIEAEIDFMAATDAGSLEKVGVDSLRGRRFNLVYGREFVRNHANGPVRVKDFLPWLADFKA